MTEEDPAFAVDVKIQRGNGTDDRDTLKATVQANTLEQLDERKAEMLDRLDELAAEVRAIQPADTTAQRIADGQTTLNGDDADA